MPEPAPRYPCPVCLGAVMVKLRPSAALDLELDYCSRCGGMWFDEGEVAALRQLKPLALYTRIVLNAEAYRMKCHQCQASLERNAPACPACGWHNVVNCPACSRPLKTIEEAGFKLDACRKCRGVWFDNVELARLWNVKVETRASAAGGGRRPPGERRSDGFLLPDVVYWDVAHVRHGPDAAPDLPLQAPSPSAVDGVVTDGPEVAGGLLHGVAQAAGGAVEWTTDLASDVFHGISDVVSSGLDALGDIDIDF
ncbi:MAG TPA: zf-TFIIB domain-containing protein [Gemmatimonadales bacterium]|nr:zf-TFIIB domain-containing protein [Gemmatimonadales bacterium]